MGNAISVYEIAFCLVLRASLFVGAGVSGVGRRVPVARGGFYAGSTRVLGFCGALYCLHFFFPQAKGRGALDKVRCGYGVLPGVLASRGGGRAAPDTLLGICVTRVT